MKTGGGRRWAKTGVVRGAELLRAPGWGALPSRRERGRGGSGRHHQGGTPRAGRLCTLKTTQGTFGVGARPRQKSRPGLTSCPGRPRSLGPGRGPGRPRRRRAGGASWAQRVQRSSRGSGRRGDGALGRRGRRHGGRRPQGGLPCQEGERAGASPDLARRGGEPAHLSGAPSSSPTAEGRPGALLGRAQVGEESGWTVVGGRLSIEKRGQGTGKSPAWLVHEG